MCVLWQSPKELFTLLRQNWTTTQGVWSPNIKYCMSFQSWTRSTRGRSQRTTKQNSLYDRPTFWGWWYPGHMWKGQWNGKVNSILLSLWGSQKLLLVIILYFFQAKRQETHIEVSLPASLFLLRWLPLFKKNQPFHSAFLANFQCL